MALEWARVLGNDRVKVFVIDPGRLATGLEGEEAEDARKSAAEDPVVGGRFVRSVIEGERDGDQGWDHSVVGSRGVGRGIQAGMFVQGQVVDHGLGEYHLIR